MINAIKKILKSSKPRKEYQWSKESDSGIRKKQYDSYDEYVDHQKSKLDKLGREGLREYDEQYHQALRDRLKDNTHINQGDSVLCLAARIGTEVKAFLDVNCFAIGIDLNPGFENKYVVYGDFHNIQFPSNSVDVLFSNSIDHVLKMEDFIDECKRVLKPSGIFIIEATKGEQQGYKFDYYEATVWDHIDDMLELFNKKGFTTLSRLDFDFPWKGGEHITLQLHD